MKSPTHPWQSRASMRALLVFAGLACATKRTHGFGLGGTVKPMCVSNPLFSGTKRPRTILGRRGSSSSSRTSMVTGADMIDFASTQILLAYSDEVATTSKSVSTMVKLIGIGGVATVGLFGFLASALKLPQTAKIELTEEEEKAVEAATLLYDSTPADRELTESGTIGEVKRRKLAMKAREDYQRGKDPREVRDKTLSYAEFDLPYFAKMMRLAKLDDGDVFLDMGSGTGKACVAAGLLYPNLAGCRGVELLDGLHRQAESYARRYRALRQPKAPIEFIRGDFCEPEVDVSEADIVFAYATKYATDRGVYLTELSRKLVDLKSGAKVITIDKRLQGPFNLITWVRTVLDPNGDLQTSTGFLWQRQ